MQSSLIQTALGKVITLYHDTNLPRPYSRIHHVQGTNGLFESLPQPCLHRGSQPKRRLGETDRVSGIRSPALENRRRTGPWRRAMGYGLPEDYRWLALRTGQPLDMDVYDAASISAVTPLSEQSLARRGRSIPSRLHEGTVADEARAARHGDPSHLTKTPCHGGRERLVAPTAGGGVWSGSLNG